MIFGGGLTVSGWWCCFDFRDRGLGHVGVFWELSVYAIAIGGGFGGFWGDRDNRFIVPMLCVGMPFWRLCVLFCGGSQRGASGDALPKQSVGTMKW